MKSRSGSRPSVIGKIAVATVLLALAACESKSSSDTSAATTTTTSTTSTTTTVPTVTSVGDTGPGGGRVIYTSTTSFACGADLKSKCNAIESAPARWWVNLKVPAECGTEASTPDPRCRWDAGTFAFGNREFLDEPGDGRQNTNFMLEAKSPAATMATSYRGGGFDDWYVPSKTEAKLQCFVGNGFLSRSLSSSCIGTARSNFVLSYYLTSSLSDREVWWLSFDESGFVHVSRIGYAYLRPVRAFFTQVAKTESATTTTAATSKAKTTTTIAQTTCGQAGVTCKVGDTTVNGGKVFYVSSAGFSCGATMSNTCHYLEVADASWHLLVLSPCVPSGSYSVLCPWGASSETYVENDSHIGGGLKSSNAVSAAYGNTGGYAAMQARSYVGGGKTDWYLPNLDELRELCKYANGQVTGTDTRCTAGTLRSDFVSEAYWSSTDSGLSRVNVINFGDPVGGASIAKNGTAQTRPIRAF